MMLSSLCRTTLSKHLEQRTKEPVIDPSWADLVSFARLETAIKNGDSSTLRKIVAAGRDIEYLTAEGSLLYHAVKCHAPLWFVEELLQLEANPNYFSYQDHQTALHLAAREGNAAILELLLDYGGNPTELDVCNRTVIEIARACNKQKCVEVLEHVVKLQHELQLQELSGVAGACEKHKRLSTIVERSEGTLVSVLNGSATGPKAEACSAHVDSLNLTSVSNASSVDALNCAFCQEASLEAELSEVSDLAITSPPSQMNFTQRSPLGAIENSPNEGCTPLRAPRVRRRLADNISFRKNSAAPNGEELQAENGLEAEEKKIFYGGSDEEGAETEQKATGIVSGLRDGLGKVAAGILAYLSPEKKTPPTVRKAPPKMPHPTEGFEVDEARSDGEETSFESAKSSATGTSDDSRASVELRNLNWTADVERVRNTDLEGHPEVRAAFTDGQLRNERVSTRCKSRYPSSLFTDDLTVDFRSRRVISSASSARTPLPGHIQTMSDEDLYEQLAALKMDPGPINDATRSIYLHQLAHLQLGNDVRLAIAPKGAESLLSEASYYSVAGHTQQGCQHPDHDPDAEVHCCEVVHRDLESGLLLREEHYGTKRAILPVNAVAASPSQAIPPELVKLSNDEVRQKLVELGETPGPVNRQTRAVYLRQLHRLQQETVSTPSPSQLRSVLPPELHMLCVQFGQVFEVYSNLETQMEASFKRPGQRWREGSAKTAFTYLLLDSSVTLNLPSRAARMSLPEQMETFVKAIFYVGKGKRSRPFAHLYEALDARSRMNDLENNAAGTPVKFAKAPKIGDKVKRILKIWGQGHGVISLHIFQNVIPVEAYTREAAMIEALGINRLLTNAKRGEFYGVADSWTTRQRKQLGAYLVYRAMQVFLAEGERRLGPLDL